MKNLLAICSHAPYGSNLAKEGLDAILAAGVFEQNLAVLFVDDGVFQLLSDQDPANLGQKNLAQALTALPLFGIELIYVEKESLEERGLTSENLVLDDIFVITRHAVSQLIDQQHQVFTF